MGLHRHAIAVITGGSLQSIYCESFGLTGINSFLGPWGAFGTKINPLPSYLQFFPSWIKCFSIYLSPYNTHVLIKRDCIGSPPQKGVTTYALSANRQRPLAGTLNAAVFNSWRRFRAQALYVIPPFAIAYVAMNWAIEKYVYTNQTLAQGNG